MLKLENQFLSIGFNENGQIVHLAHVGGENIISRPAADFFHITLAGHGCQETLVWAHEQKVICKVEGNRFTATMTEVKTDNGRDDAPVLPVAVNFYATLNGEHIEFTADIDNPTDYYVTDFEYPHLGVIKSLGCGAPDLFWPEQPGQLHYNPGKELAANYGPECDCCKMVVTYPSFACIGLTALFDKENTLMLSTRDPQFIACEFIAEGDHDDPESISLTVDKHVCTRERKGRFPLIDVMFYAGDWHKGAASYADWIRDYRAPHKSPDWVRDMTGYYLVINKQQYGYELWDYTTLPKLYELASANGCDVVGLFGWFQTGHDNDYPDLEVSHTMGGAEELRKGIRGIHDMGGHVTLYYQGHLIDTTSKYYRSGEGERIAAKNIWGSIFTEYFPKAHRSHFLQNFSHRMFTMACPSCPEWREMMDEREKWVASFGADGALFDQIGGMPPYVCFDHSHHHEDDNPGTALPMGQIKMVQSLQRVSKEISPDFAFMSEHETDIYSGSLDMCHGINVKPDEKPGARVRKEEYAAYSDIFRYCFPHTMLSLRNPRPHADNRQVNFCFCYGFALEMEVRYRGDKVDILNDKFKDEREYCAYIAAFRRKYVELLSRGTFTDTVGIDLGSSPENLFVKGFASDGRLAVTIWNDSAEAITPDIAVPGKKLAFVATPDGTTTKEFRSVGANEIALAVFED